MRAKDLIYRCMAIFDAEDQSELAKMMDYSPAAITLCIKRDTIPYKGIIKLCAEHNVSIDSVFTPDGALSRSDLTQDEIELIEDRRKKEIFFIKDR